MPAARERFTAGLKALAPILLGTVPFATITGIAAADIGMTPLEGQGMSLIVFAGAAQLAGLQLLAADAAPWVIILTSWVINLRFMLYSASLGAYFKNLPARWKALLAHLLTDQAYAVSIIEFESHPERPHKRWFFFGAGLLLWLTWQLGTAAGLLLGAGVPESWSLDFAIPLTFIALIIPAIKDRAAGAAALAAGFGAVLATGLPFNLGLPLAGLLGILVGLLFERRAS